MLAQLNALNIKWDPFFLLIFLSLVLINTTLVVFMCTHIKSFGRDLKATHTVLHFRGKIFSGGRFATDSGNETKYPLDSVPQL